jgi:Ni,Fe-hydrogenase III small subunit
MLRLLRQIARIGIISEPPPRVDPAPAETELQRQIRRTFGHALAIRHVDAGSCNACELEIHALHNPYYNLEGAGVRFVASPRHADALLVTGPVSRHMVDALRSTYAAMPGPKFVIAVGDCAACGGIFGRSYATIGPVADVIPVDVTVPGCPPTPRALLEGILTAIRMPRAG